MLSKESVFQELSEYMLEDEFADAFEEFSHKYCDIFTDDEESKLEYMDIYKKFQSLFEKKLEEFLKSKGVSLDQFQEMCKDLPEDSEASQVIQFILALSEYDVFLRMMQEQARKKRGEE